MTARDRIYTMGLIRQAELELNEAIIKLDEGEPRVAAVSLREAVEAITKALALNL